MADTDKITALRRQIELLTKHSESESVNPKLRESAKQKLSVLRKQLEALEKGEKSPAASEPAKSGPSSSKSEYEDLKKIVDVMRSVIQQVPKKGEIDIERVSEIADDRISKATINMGQLSSEVQAKLESSKIIKVMFPDERPTKETKEFGDKPVVWKILDDICNGHNVFLIGGAGTGKTYLAEAIANDLLGQPYIIVNCSQWTSPVELIGGQTVSGYTQGKLIDCWAKGWILILDEMPKLDPNTAGLLNDALAKSVRLSKYEKESGKKKFIFDQKGEKFEKHDNFAVIATGNVYPLEMDPKYPANNPQDMSLLDRFSSAVYWIQKDPVMEYEKVIKNAMVWEFCDKLRTALDKHGYTAAVMSLRTMGNFVRTFNFEVRRLEEEAKEKQSGSKPSPDKAEYSKFAKTLKDAIISYLSVFTSEQIGVLKKDIDYEKFIASYKSKKFQKEAEDRVNKLMEQMKAELARTGGEQVI